MKAKRHSAIPRANRRAGLASSFSLTEKLPRATSAQHDERNPAGILTQSMASLPPSRFFNQWLSREQLSLTRGWSLYLLTVAQPSRILTGFPDAGLRRNPATCGTLSKSGVLVGAAEKIAKKKFGRILKRWGVAVLSAPATTGRHALELLTPHPDALRTATPHLGSGRLSFACNETDTAARSRRSGRSAWR